MMNTDSNSLELRRRITAVAADSTQLRRRKLDAVEMIERISDCSQEADAFSNTGDAVRALGAESFVYVTLLPSQKDPYEQSRHYFIGCCKELCRLYNQRYWMLIDPFLEYALRNTAPITGSQIKVVTAGQRELMRVSSEHGFRSGLVVPTHTSMDAGRRMGLLYIGSDLASAVGEPLLFSKRIQFISLATELLFWWSRHLRARAMRRYSLADEEMELLQLASDGKSAAEIAAILDMRVSKIYRRLDVIKDKLSVERLEHAIAQASALGLLSC